MKTITCTVTNDDRSTTTAKVIVTKVVDGGPNSPEQFTICVNSFDRSTGLQTPATPPCAPGSGSGFTYIIIPGQIFFIFEPGPPRGDYNSFHSCVPGTVTAGETATCTYSCK